MTDAITARDFEAADGLEAWRVLSAGAYAFFRTDSFAESARLVAGVAELSAVDSHPPAIDVRHDGVTFRLVTATDESMGMTTLDVEVARAISALAGDLGLSADPAGLQDFLVVSGAPDVAAIMPFWKAMLGYVPRPDSPDEDLVDPHDRDPGFWFETMDEPRPGDLGALHIGIFLPTELAEARVQAALAAGGRMVRASAPAWWTLADAAGNEADIGTIPPRD